MQHRQASEEPTRKIARAQHGQNLSKGKEWQSRVDDRQEIIWGVQE